VRFGGASGLAKNKKFNPANRARGMGSRGKTGSTTKKNRRAGGTGFLVGTGAHGRGGHTGGATTKAMVNPGGGITSRGAAGAGRSREAARARGARCPAR
jgi:hypothetical protein